MGDTLRLLRSELGLILGRRRNLVGLLVLAAVPVLIAVSVRLSSSGRRGGGPDFLSEITSNGLFVAFAALAVEVTLFLPMALAMLSGDAIAGEAHAGTLRYLLTVPVSRTKLLLVKYASLVVGGLIGASVVAVVGAVVGIALFGTGPLTTLAGSQLGMGEAVWRLVLAVLYVTAGLAGLAALGLFISTLTEQPIAVVVAVVVLTAGMWILDSIPQLDWLAPWLIVHEWTAFSDVLRDPPLWSSMRQGLLVDAAYAVISLLAAWARFGSKDITS